MVALSTPNLDTNFSAQDFNLLGIDGRYYSLNNFRGFKGLVVMFICNHCPYVKAIITKLVHDVEELHTKHNVGAVAIMPNDTESYPEDSYENMVLFAKEHKFNFPYLIDDTQEVAKKYGAVCTPDFFGFNSELKLCYRGCFDKSGMNEINNEQKDHDLFNAMVYTATTGRPIENQRSSIGCSIKWKG
ncbi:thioredoxin family protein [Candidatus Mesenet endosymbiont of Agriotes lineatus]|uniref:thioredoxin family protein n=1 Tax=Candidatus Mesenet endosymbiont of Agriotes lineatus TaxID=3077948 RepID=UPI0030CCDFCB